MNRKLWTGMLLVAGGVTLLNLDRDDNNTLYVIFIAFGGFLFLMAMRELKARSSED